MENEIIPEISKLLEKTGLEDLIPLAPPVSTDNEQLKETVLINIKSFNARYDKEEALNQVQWLMERYNIQIDELMTRISM